LAPSNERGLTLIEAMVALCVMLIGALGMFGLHSQGQRMNGDALRMTRATAIAQDLAGQIELWPWGDDRLVNQNAANDLLVGDPDFEFENPTTTFFDYGEAGLTLNGNAWLGIPTADIQAAGFQRFWNVSYANVDSNANGRPDAVRIAVIVRWPSGTGFRRVVLVSVKNNPAEAR
jgi:hypothetical protein